MKEYDTVKIKISDIKIDGDNPNKMESSMSDRLSDSVTEFGNTQDVVIDKNTMFLADGEHRLREYIKRGLSEIPAKLVEFESDAHRRAYRQAANKIHGVHDTDLDLAEYEKIIKEDKDLLKMSAGVSLSEVEKHLRRLELENKEEVFDEEQALEEAEKEPITKLGDVWKLGKHVLMCGDSTKTEDVGILIGEDKIKVLITDPPYNTGMDKKTNCDSTRLNHMFNDNMDNKEWNEFLNSFINTLNVHSEENSVFYIFMDWRRIDEWYSIIKPKFKISNLVVWDKMVHGLGSDYKYTHEFIAVCKKGKPLLETHQNTEYKDIWAVQRKVGRNEYHATAKPLELITIPIRHASNDNDTIVDLFGGSGTTLIACEKSYRVCKMMELDPLYCDVIIKRWEEFTGFKAEKLNNI